MENTPVKLSDEWVKVVLEECKTLRGESLQAISNQLSILQVGTGAVGVLFAAGFGLLNVESLISLVLFLFLLPLVCYLSLIIWIGEVQRMMRVGFYIKELEIKVNQTFIGMPPALNWEHYLRTKKGDSKTPQMTLNYIGIIFLFFTIAVISIIIGSLKTKLEYQSAFNVYITISAVVFVCVSFYIIDLCLKLKKS